MTERVLVWSGQTVVDMTWTWQGEPYQMATKCNAGGEKDALAKLTERAMRDEALQGRAPTPAA